MSSLKICFCLYFFIPFFYIIWWLDGFNKDTSLRYARLAKMQQMIQQVKVTVRNLIIIINYEFEHSSLRVGYLSLQCCC